MTKNTIFAFGVTVIAILVFYLPIIEIYALYYLTPFLDRLDVYIDANTLFHLFSLLIPAVCGFIASALSHVILHKYLRDQDVLVLILIPGCVLGGLSVISDRLDAGSFLAFSVAISITPLVAFIRHKGDHYVCKENNDISSPALWWNRTKKGN